VPSTSTAAAPTVVPITGDPDAGGPGSLARALLEASSPYRRVVVQVDVAGDAAPPSAVVDRLVTILQTETEKPVTRVDGDHFAGQGKGCWTEDELAQATRDHRHARTSSVTVALYVVFLDGTACGDANTLGVAYGASEMAVFTDATNDVSGPTVDPERFIEAVAVHELGHTLGLVNIGYRSPIDHEDPQHPHHSSDRASVMYWAIDRGDLIQQFVTGPPRAFDRADESDLAGLRDGSL
jgi:hypothetical protein